MIPLVDLKAQYAAIRDEVAPAMQRVLDSCEFSLGSEVAAFEQEFAAYCEVSHAVGMNSGTSALHLALLAAGIGPGDEVITVPFTFVATVSAIQNAGATPVFVDIDPDTFTMNVSQVEAAITSRTRAIVPVHLYGQPADMDAINAIARASGLVVIEDACQAHGARYKGRRVGSLGDIGCFSFYPGKNLGAYGEGGAATTSNPEYARKLRMLRDWGAETKYHHVLKGFNFRLDGIQGAVLRVKLRHLDSWNGARRDGAAHYNQLLRSASLATPTAVDHTEHVWHVYAVRTGMRAALQHALQTAGSASGIHYPVPVHLQPAYADLGYKEGSFPEAERASREVLSLPMFPELTEAQRELVAKAIVTSHTKSAA
jgi:dTDP-4-amino-4,6-dideoxygalactose transaminase